MIRYEKVRDTSRTIGSRHETSINDDGEAEGGEPTLIHHFNPEEPKKDAVIELRQDQVKSTPEEQIENLRRLRRQLWDEMARLREAAGGKTGSPEANRYMELYEEYQDLTHRMQELQKEENIQDEQAA